MAHQNYYLDFTVAVFVVHDQKVLLVHHRGLAKWLPVGGHIDPGEDPAQAARRETREESGLEIELLGDRPPREFPQTRLLPAPAYLDVHDIQGEHKHLGMIYFARAHTSAVQLAEREHFDIRWFTADDLATSTLTIPESIRFYGQEALRRVSPTAHAE